MVLNIIILLLLVAIAYFHYAQGLFSATVSAVCAGVAALMAFAFHESLARVGDGAMGSYGNAVALAVMFGVIYIVLRFLIDNFMAGNVRYPVAVDKVGAGIMGVIAGIFATGIVALAAQSLPFGTDVAMYGRFDNEDLEVAAPRRLGPAYRLDPRDSSDDLMIYRDALATSVLESNDETGDANNLWVPTDSWLVGLVNKLSSADGSLSGPTPIAAVYPGGSDGFKNALFARRIGLQRAALQVAINTDTEKQVNVADPGGVFLIGTGPEEQFPGGILQVDGELRGRSSMDIDKRRTPGNGKSLIVIRTLFDKTAADKRSLVRFGLANARLVAGGKQYFPIGTLDSGRVFAAGKPDDYILTSAGADLVYEVETATALDANGKALAGDAFLEFKELARVPLGGDRVYAFVTQDARANVLRKKLTQEWIAGRLDDQILTETSPTTSWDELRNNIPDIPADPAQAEALFLGGDDPADAARLEGVDPTTGESPTTQSDDPGEGEGNTLGIGDALRDRNRQLQGDGQ